MLKSKTRSSRAIWHVKATMLQIKQFSLRERSLLLSSRWTKEKHVDSNRFWSRFSIQERKRKKMWNLYESRLFLMTTPFLMRDKSNVNHTVDCDEAHQMRLNSVHSNAARFHLSEMKPFGLFAAHVKVENEIVGWFAANFEWMSKYQHFLVIHDFLRFYYRHSNGKGLK